MTDKTPKNKKKKINMPTTPPRPTMQMWVLAALVFLIFGIAYFNRSNATIQINQQQFDDMVLSHDVERLVVIKNKDIVEVTLAPSALENEKYRKIVPSRNAFTLEQGPHFFLPI